MSDDCWLVTAGEYSDYYVVAVFSTQAAADAFAADWQAHVRKYEPMARVERADFDPPLPVRKQYPTGPRKRTADEIAADVKANV